jgi:hypothetical protein
MTKHDAPPRLGMIATHKVFAKGIVVSEGPDICVIESVGALYSIRRETNWDDWVFKIRMPELGDRFQHPADSTPEFTVIALGDDQVVIRYDYDSSDLTALVLNGSGEWIDLDSNQVWTSVID